jgi:hypothetical protein
MFYPLQSAGDDAGRNRNEDTQMQVTGGKAATATLLAINGVLVLTLWLQLGATPQDAVAAVPAAAPPVPLSLPTVQPELPPFSAYQDVIERPLFWEERRRQQDAVALPADGATAQVPFILLGVVQAAQSHAVLGRSGSKDVNRVYVGDVVEGWIVESMTRDSVTLMANGVRRELQFGTGRTGAK